ncbi:Tachykinin [Lucilia cuprina]|uniref:Tachykinin n=1 Tax=Lucilia cuprina TaxID=7375 RepID=A0A0L0BZ10_LUCCU|nr:Tachykinin [Lucilia cuprina]
MAKTKKQQQLLVIYLTICLVIVSLLMKVDSVRALSLPLDGNMLQQQQQQHQQQSQKQQQIDNNIQEHNYVMDQAKLRPTTIEPNNGDVLESDDDDISKENNLRDDLTSNQMILGHSYEPLNMVKRAPGGFVGMRGKKLYYDDEEINNLNDNDNRLPWSQLQNSEEDISWDEYAKPNVRRYKKTPTAFYGVRGKKFATMNGANPSNDNHRWQEFLQKLEEERVRDAILQNFVETLTGTQNDLPNEMSKRAPTGFTGVRGKRPVINDLDSSMETLTKRGLGNNAFVGVRGKKDVSHQTFKRSPSGAERYFFVFWKKSLPGGSGKRQRFVDFNNKFVAVRGKKSSYDGMSAFNTIDNNRSPSSSAAMSLFYGKRAPNGFLGVRGKRPFTTDDILSVN